MCCQCSPVGYFKMSNLLFFQYANKWPLFHCFQLSFDGKQLYAFRWAARFSNYPFSKRKIKVRQFSVNRSFGYLTRRRMQGEATDHFPSVKNWKSVQFYVLQSRRTGACLIWIWYVFLDKKAFRQRNSEFSFNFFNLFFTTSGNWMDFWFQKFSIRK